MTLNTMNDTYSSSGRAFDCFITMKLDLCEMVSFVNEYIAFTKIIRFS